MTNNVKATDAAKAAAKQRAADRIEDIRWLQQGGVSRPEIASRLGLDERSLQRWMDRWGHTW